MTISVYATRFVIITLLGMLVACASYHPVALETAPKMLSAPGQLRTDASGHAELPAIWRGRIKLADGLSEDEIVQLAVLNSPHLAAVRATRLESGAKLIQAGLLPDPQLGLAADFPRSNDPALVAGYGVSLGFDLQALITRSARQNAATRQARTVYLQVLWQEWQVIGQARMLYRRALMQQRQIMLTHAQFKRTQGNWQVQKNALDRGDATLDSEALARTSMMDAEAAWFEAKRQHNTTTHQLALLLGVSPQIKLPLSLPKQGLAALIMPPVQADALQQRLNAIHHQRPDLLALQAGYAAQEANVRAQILSQFPGFSIGANSLRDTGKIWSLGPFINLNLPLLNGNRGNIAMARATRSRLQAEYRDRLLSAKNDAGRLVSDQQLAFDELAALKKQLPDLDQMMQRMQQALDHGNVNMLIFTTLQNSHFAQRMKVLLLEQAVMEQAVALDTVLGALPVMDQHRRQQP